MTYQVYSQEIFSSNIWTKEDLIQMVLGLAHLLCQTKTLKTCLMAQTTLMVDQVTPLEMLSTIMISLIRFRSKKLQTNQKKNQSALIKKKVISTRYWSRSKHSKINRRSKNQPKSQIKSLRWHPLTMRYLYTTLRIPSSQPQTT